MPNARPAFMEKVILTSGGADTWRFYPQRAVDTWEVIITSNSTTLKFEGITSEWEGESFYDINDSNEKTILVKNTPAAGALVDIAGQTSVGDAEKTFAVDLGFKGLQVSATGGGSGTVLVKAYMQGKDHAIGSGYITATAQTS